MGIKFLTVSMHSSIKIVGYNLTEDSAFMDRQNHMSPYLKERIQELYFDLQKGNGPVISEILALIERFPQNPQLKNYLSVAYNNLGNIEKSEEVNNWILKEHPDYLFGILNKAAEYFYREEYYRIPDLLGKNMELKELYPDRKVFHIGEFTSFTKFAIQYYFETGNLDAARSRLDLMLDLFPDHQDTQIIQEWYNSRLAEKGLKIFDDEETIEADPAASRFSEPQSRENPVFKHHEIYCLYEFDLSIPKVFLENILALPRKSLIADLELVLNDSISRYRYFEELDEKKSISDANLTFPLHAIFLLGELRAKESLPKILHFLSLDSDFLLFWLGDHKTESMFEPLYYTGESQLEKLKKFMFKPDIDTYVKTSLLTAVQQVYLYQPHRVNEVVGWYEDVIDFFVKNAENKRITDSVVLAFLISDIMEIKENRLLPKISKLFNRNKVSEGICDDIQAFKTEINKTGNIYENKRELLDIFTRYQSVLDTFLSDNYFSASELLRNSPIFPEGLEKEVYPNIGRDDPCPCGSGKKFQKCCMNRLN